MDCTNPVFKKPASLQKSLNVQKTNPHQAISQPIIPAATPYFTGPQDALNSLRIHNVVSSVNLCCELNLRTINNRTRFSEYNPSRFHGVVMRLREPKCTSLIFRTGKFICAGTKTENDSHLASRKFARIIQKLGYPVRFTDFKIINLVATVDLRFPIRLENLCSLHAQFCSYEPEIFPGVVYRMVKPRMCLLIFANGKIVFTAAKSKKSIEECIEIIYPILLSFKKS